MSCSLSFSTALFISVVAFAALLPSPTLSTSLAFNVTANIDDGEFYVQLLIGNTLRSLALDTESDLIWTYNCSEASTSYSRLGCFGDLCEKSNGGCCKSKNVCEYIYHSTNRTFQVDLATDNFKFEDCVSKLVVSCGALENESGGLGLGRSPPSLVSQTSSNTFSYCLPNFDDLDKNGFLLVGSPAKSHPNMIYTRLVSNQLKPSRYYMSVKGISVNKARLKIPTSAFEINEKTGTGGFIIDVGSTLSYFNEQIYVPLVNEINKTIHLKPSFSPKGVDLPNCFSMPSNNRYKFPRITIHFSPFSRLTLSAANTFRTYTDPITNQDVSCLAITKSLPSDNGMSRFGGMQQLNTVVFMDLANQMVGFLPNSDCGTMSSH